MIMEWYLDSLAVENEILHWEASYECSSSVDACPENNITFRDIEIGSGPLRQVGESAQLYSMRSQGIRPQLISNSEVLSYIVNFQNPLETTIYNVLVIDTLPEQLNFNSISQSFSSANNYDFRVTEGGVLIAQLNGINLTNAEENEARSYGFNSI